MSNPAAEELRKAFRAIPKEKREANQSFAIRMWRAISWLERSEQANEVEDQFITSWIAMNALYGRVDEENRPWGDREALGAFLATVWNTDTEGKLRRILNKRQLVVLRLTENKFLYDKFWWNPGANYDHKLHKIVKELLPRFGTYKMLPVLRTVFDRLYVMRNQVFHGASTKGSYLNRRILNQSTALLGEFLPVMIEIMMQNGIECDWGDVCFPPIK